MKYVVSWSDRIGMEGKEAEVEAETRWEAVVEAATQLGLAGLAPMQQLFNLASVRKAGGAKKTREWRFDNRLSKLVEEADKKLGEA